MQIPATETDLDLPPYLFSVVGDQLRPTDFVRGPWDHGLQHGGAVCGALGWAANDLLQTTEASSDFRLCRLTTEIMRPVPVAPLRFEANVDHHGRRSRVVSSSLWHDDRLVARASSQWVRVRADQMTKPAEAFDSSDGAAPIRPETITDPGASDLGYPRPGFNCDVFEFRCLQGSTESAGPGTAWVRLKADLIGPRNTNGGPPDPVHLLATVSDLGNALGWEHSINGEPMVNPDVTLQLFRYPIDEWICLESRLRSTAAGIGMMETVLWDNRGQIGRILSTTMESTLPLTVRLPGPAGRI